MLGWNVSTYYVLRALQASSALANGRCGTNTSLMTDIRRVGGNYLVYGYGKIHAQLNREGFDVAECTVRRLMNLMGIAGVVRGYKRPKTTVSDESAVRTCSIATSPRRHPTWGGSSRH